MERCRITKNGSMDFDYCQGNSTIILSFERETGKWTGWKELAGILWFSETGRGITEGPNSERAPEEPASPIRDPHSAHPAI